MPLIQVNMASGRTPEQKTALLKAITKAVHESIDAPIASIRVWLNEFAPEEFAAGGETMAERRSREGTQ
ncbi:MAG: 2-hydroxymuconate tautomerase [Acidimicrobiia bacterium]